MSDGFPLTWNCGRVEVNVRQLLEARFDSLLEELCQLWLAVHHQQAFQPSLEGLSAAYDGISAATLALQNDQRASLLTASQGDAQRIRSRSPQRDLPSPEDAD
jgi:hypothetical protein